MTLKQKFQNEIETESTASLNMGDVLSWGVLIFGEGHRSRRETIYKIQDINEEGPGSSGGEEPGAGS